ncbi:LysM domain-containing protein [Methylomicrobium sp. Wu6]|uniref:LysM peptidoglycan-binding domain-containing protein n=1 Tax=Methylomicrobium sp. Wu6 TaxID=3107928 RepID=UPI002DD65F08|nr:LysM domain-containing protein [Methylomicrobium sp. Wu6]MEC4749499.1 LysM domain-containing protein [Methylomicrobium sp. Wu6]
MAFRTILRFIVPLVYCSALLADEVKLNPSHPDRYTVAPGDTLWDISGKFLKNPGQWPLLWSYNNQIRNPHLIYPGDTVYFSMVNGQPQLSFSPTETLGVSPSAGPCVLSDADIKSGRTSFATSAEGKLQPCIRESATAKAIQLIPAEAIQKYLSLPRVLGQNELNAAPYIVDLAGEHLIVGNGDKVYVRAIDNPQTLTYSVYREGDTLKNPTTQEVLGFEAKYIADLTLLEPGDPATLMITKAKREINVGDRILPTSEQEVVLNYFPMPPEESIKGNIIGVLDGVTQVGLYNVVVIDKGAADGLKTGHELSIYQRGKIARDPYSQVKNDEVQMPDEYAGKLMVFRPFERVSYALVMQAQKDIHVLDKVQTPE